MSWDPLNDGKRIQWWLYAGTQMLPLVPIQDQWCIGCDAKNIFPQRISNKNTKYSIYKYVLIYLPKLIKSWYLKKSWIKVDKTIDNVDR